MPDIHFRRSYWASGNNMDWAAAMQLCENMGKGLVKWDTADKYLDMKFLAGQGAYWTALTNTNGNGCNSPSVCDGLLVQSDKKKNIELPLTNSSPLGVAANIERANSNLLIHIRLRPTHESND